MRSAEEAKATGASRFLHGGAWKGVREGDPKFDSVLEMVRKVSTLGMKFAQPPSASSRTVRPAHSRMLALRRTITILTPAQTIIPIL